MTIYVSLQIRFKMHHCIPLTEQCWQKAGIWSNEDGRLITLILYVFRCICVWLTEMPSLITTPAPASLMAIEIQW